MVRNVTAISIRKNSNGSFRLKFERDDKDTWDDFYFQEVEIRHIIECRDFFPFYVDCYTILQFTGTYLRIIELNQNNSEIWIPFRRTELEPKLKEALALEPDVDLDLLPAYLDSKVKTEPCVNENIGDDALEITQLEGIAPYLERVRQIARNSSKGIDDPVKLGFFKDFESKSLYWAISRNNNLIMNGGVIYDKNRNDWGIHT